MDIKERIQDLTLDQKAKLYFMGLLRKGLIDTLPEDPKAAYIRDMMDKENPRMNPAIRSDFDDPTLKEVATKLGYLKELERPSFTNQKYYDLLNDLRDEGLLKSGISSLQSKFNLSREKAKEIFDEYLEDLKAEQPDAFNFFMKDLNEGDTYEKMAAKGKKKGNLKQGTVRKRLKIKDGEKIPLSKINKAISKIKKMENPSEKNKKYLKALNLAKTLKTTTNVREMANELGYLSEEDRFKGFADQPSNNKDYLSKTLSKAKEKFGKVKEKMTISFTYTAQGSRFYSMTVNKEGKRIERFSSAGEGEKYLKSLNVNEKIPLRYDTTELDKLVKSLKTAGVEASYNDAMDVS